MRDRRLHAHADQTVGIIHRLPRVYGKLSAAVVRVPIISNIQLCAVIHEHLYDLCAALVAGAVSLQPRPGRKSARGHHRAASSPIKIGLPEIPRSASAVQAFKLIAKQVLAQIEANESGAAKNVDPEYVHQMRIAVRRLSSLIGAYSKVISHPAVQSYKDELKRLEKALGPARDMTVVITEIWPSLRAALPINRPVEKIDSFWNSRQHATTRQLVRALAARRYKQTTSAFKSWLDTAPSSIEWTPKQLVRLAGPARDFASDLLGCRDAKVRHFGGSLKSSNDAQMHALRIRIKKLCYAVDSFGSLFERKVVDNLEKRLARLQSVLGDMHDQSIVERQVAHALKRVSRRAGAQIFSAIAAWRTPRAKEIRHKLRVAWRKYRHAKRFW